MPATPAWPPSSLPRLFVDQAIEASAMLTLEGAPANYLGNVLRLATGAQVKLFDDRTGEWLGRIVDANRKRVTLEITRHLRERETVPDLWLVFAPIKQGRIDWLVEKATELGVARLVPVTTRRTIVDRINSDRLRAHSIEAAEQCERTALPELAPLAKLESLLRDWPADRSPAVRRRGRRRSAPAGRRARPRRAADRSGRGLHRGGARRHPGRAAGAGGVARPTHPARRYGRAGGGQRLDGRCRRLVAPRKSVAC